MKLEHGDMFLPFSETSQILTIEAEITGKDICNRYEINVYPEAEKREAIPWL